MQIAFDYQHAVVIGASMTGLLAARVLSDYFKEVTIVERDQLTTEVKPRKGVPQGRHVHILLTKGETILGELFPDLYEAFIQGGAVPVSANEEHWYDAGRWKLPSPDPTEAYCSSRPLLELYVRRCLACRNNVHIIDNCEVNRLCAGEDGKRITGLSLVYAGAQRREEKRAADLVVDASGRGSRVPQWLNSLGYGKVEETSVKVDVGYATSVYRRPATLPRDWKLLLIYPTPPWEKRSGYVFPIENDCWMVTLMGRLRDYPPDNETDFLAYARSLPEPSLYEAIKEAEPVTPVVTYKYSMNRWRHYERMPRFPEGVVILGDAVCSFNPVYGQGMSVAALEARLLDIYLQRCHHTQNGLAGFSRQFQRAVSRAVKVPWMLATSEDFRYPETEGKRPFGIHLFHWYTRRVNELTAFNPFVAEKFYEVLDQFKPLALLYHPRIVWTVLLRELARCFHELGASSTADQRRSPGISS